MKGRIRTTTLLLGLAIALCLPSAAHAATIAVDETADELSATIAEHEPGDWVSLSFTDSTGVASGATVTLVEGPAA